MRLELFAERLQFVVKPKDARLVAGSDVTIACSAHSASLSWRRVGVAVLPDHVTSEEGRLRLRGVRRSDAGLYVCTATSSDYSRTIDTTIRIDVTGRRRRYDLSLGCPVTILKHIQCFLAVFRECLPRVAIGTVARWVVMPPPRRGGDAGIKR